MKEQTSLKKLTVIIEITIEEIKHKYKNKDIEKPQFDKLITKTCEKNNIDEDHIRKIAGWEKIEKKKSDLKNKEMKDVKFVS